MEIFPFVSSCESEANVVADGADAAIAEVEEDDNEEFAVEAKV